MSGLRGMMGSKPQLPEKWIVPETEDDIKEILRSGTHVIYKHSFSCATCIFTKLRVEEVLNELSEKAKFHFIDVKQSRNLSNLVSAETEVQHESPQILLIKNGQVFWHASHGNIQKEKIIEALK